MTNDDVISSTLLIRPVSRLLQKMVSVRGPRVKSGMRFWRRGSKLPPHQKEGLGCAVAPLAGSGAQPPPPDGLHYFQYQKYPLVTL